MQNTYHAQRASTPTTGPAALGSDNGDLWTIDILPDLDLESVTCQAVLDEPFNFGLLPENRDTLVPLPGSLFYSPTAREAVESPASLIYTGTSPSARH